MKKVLQFLYIVWFIVWFVVLFFISLPFLIISTILGQKTSERLVYFTIRQYSLLLMFGLGIRKQVYNAPEGITNSVILPNHNSYFDPISIYMSIDQPFKTLGKIELAKIPVFGFLVHRTTILVDRSNNASRKASYDAMKDYLKIVNIVLYPQGKIEEEELFKPKVYGGGFKLAKDGESNIYPCLLLDNMDRLPPDSVWKVSPGKMRIIYLDPMPYSYVKEREMGDLMNDYIDYMMVCIERSKDHDPEDVVEFSKKWLAQRMKEAKLEHFVEI